MSSKAKRPSLLDKLVTVRAMMLVNQTWQKKVDELEARIALLEKVAPVGVASLEDGYYAPANGDG